MAKSWTWMDGESQGNGELLGYANAELRRCCEFS